MLKNYLNNKNQNFNNFFDLQHLLKSFQKKRIIEVRKSRQMKKVDKIFQTTKKKKKKKKKKKSFHFWHDFLHQKSLFIPHPKETL